VTPFFAGSSRMPFKRFLMLDSRRHWLRDRHRHLIPAGFRRQRGRSDLRTDRCVRARCAGLSRLHAPPSLQKTIPEAPRPMNGSVVRVRGMRSFGRSVGADANALVPCRRRRSIAPSLNLAVREMQKARDWPAHRRNVMSEQRQSNWQHPDADYREREETEHSTADERDTRRHPYP